VNGEIERKKKGGGKEIYLSFHDWWGEGAFFAHAQKRERSGRGTFVLFQPFGGTGEKSLLGGKKRFDRHLLTRGTKRNAV